MDQGNAEALLHKGYEVLGSGQEGLAVEFFQRGLTIAPEHSGLLKALGETLMDMGRADEARNAFERCAKADSSDGGVWMYLGQLASGKDALGHYEKGLETMRQQLTLLPPDSEDLLGLARMVASAYCSIAELYMSDLCFEPDAEKVCMANLELADKCLPDNPQTLQTMASVLISMCKPEEAKPLILRASAIMEDLMIQIDDLTPNVENGGVADNQGDTEMGGEGDSEMQSGSLGIEELEMLLPPFEFRSATGRILIEVGEIDRAISFLDRLVAENDEIAEVWLLLATCHTTKGSKHEALECVEHAEQLCDRLVAFDSQLTKDEQFMNMVSVVKKQRKDVEALPEPETAVST
mmetsp:Transcript_20387/g.37895  ORF Transcript_20387/g.37895 Transcript_20387/m.37895 type:complete len:351 (-) Transcript_20387:118-1170(-)